MKKFTTVLLAMLLVLVVGQAAFANFDISANVGYAMGIGAKKFNAVGFGVNGGYYFTDKIGIGVGVDGIIELGETDAFGNMFNISAVVKYNAFAFDAVDLGFQAGIVDSIAKDKPNMLAVVVGAFVNADIANKVNLTADVKIPVYTMYKEVYGDTPADNDAGFFKAFLYDAKIGVTYDVTPDISVGGQIGIGNINFSSVDSFKGDTNNNFSTLTIGVKAGYTF